MCGDIYLFHFLIYFSVYKFGSQTNPSLDLEANDPSKPRLHKFKGLLMMPDIWGLIFLGILDDVAHKLKSAFNSNLNIIYKIRQLFISRKFSLKIYISFWLFSILKDESSTSAKISIQAWIIQREKIISAKTKCFYDNKIFFNPS